MSKRKNPENPQLPSDQSEQNGNGHSNLGKQNELPVFTLKSELFKKKTPEQKEADDRFNTQADARHSYGYGKVFFEMYREDRQDQETGFVEFDSHRSREGEATAYDYHKKNKEKIEAWEARTTEIVNHVTYSVLDSQDGTVVYKIRRVRYDQGGLTPTIAIEDVPQALLGMIRAEQELCQLEQEDPIEAGMVRAERKSKHRVLAETITYITLQPADTSELGFVVSLEETKTEFGDELGDFETAILSDYSEEFLSSEDGFSQSKVHKAISMIRFNQFQEVRNLLHKAVSSEAPEHYAEIVTLEARRRLLEMIHSEIAQRNRENRLPENKLVFDVSLHAVFQGDWIMPVVEYYLSSTQVDEELGQLVLKTVRLSRDIVGSGVERKIYQDGFNSPDQVFRDKRSFNQLSDISMKAVTNWKEWKTHRIATMGEQAHLQDLYTEFLQLELAAGVEVAVVPADAEISRGYIALDGSYSGSLTTLSLRENHFYNRTGQSVFNEVQTNCYGDFDEVDPDFAALVLFMQVLY